MNTDKEQMELDDIEKSADDLLMNLAASRNVAVECDLQKLEQLAMRAAKIAFGAGHADLLSEQMQNLIRWTDHMNDQSWVADFKVALQKRPLVAPW